MNMSGDLKHIEFHGDTLYATTINAGMRGPHNHVLWPCPTVLELVDFSHVAGGV